MKNNADDMLQTLLARMDARRDARMSDESVRARRSARILPFPTGSEASGSFSPDQAAPVDLSQVRASRRKRRTVSGVFCYVPRL